jgi:histidinol-phosphate aminotransferase
MRVASTGASPSLVRLAANENPLGPFPAAREAVARHLGELHRYPSLDFKLIDRLADVHGVAAERVALGNGADAIIGYLSAALLGPGDEAVMGWPSFPTHRLDAVKAGASPVLAPLTAGACDLDAIAERISPRTKLVWVCSPNNPTGGVVGRRPLERFLDGVPERVPVVIDEAYYEYAAGPDHVDGIAEHVERRPNVGVLRTFSKIYGLAALRVGYFVGPPGTAAALRNIRHYYDVSELANVAALASLDEPGELERRRLANLSGRARLEDGIDTLGLERFPSHTNFVAVQVPDAAAVAKRLLTMGIAVRSLEDVDAPNLLRITVGSTHEVDHLLAALPEAM